MALTENVVVVGAGAMGAVYACKFFEMDKSCVSLLGGGKRGRRLRDEGLVVNDKRIFPRVQDPENVNSPADLIIVAVKHQHLAP